MELHARRMKRAREAGARHAFMTLLRLPGNVAPYFEQRLRENMPTKADRILNRLREMRGGRLNSSEFGERRRGHGEYWRMIEQSFRLHCERNKFNQHADVSGSEPRHTFRRPAAQASLFE